MSDDLEFYGTAEAAQQLNIKHNTLQAWLSRHPEYRPSRRISGDDLLWLPEDIERVRQAREKTAKHGRRKETSEE